MNEFQQSLPMLLYRTLDGVMPEFRRLFARHGLTEQQWRVLRVLWENDAQPLLSLARVTLLPSPSLVGVIDRMQRDGLVRRQRSNDDRRVVMVCLAARGRDLQARLIPEVNTLYARLQACLDAEEWALLQATLLKLNANVARLADAPSPQQAPDPAPSD